MKLLICKTNGMSVKIWVLLYDKDDIILLYIVFLQQNSQ